MVLAVMGITLNCMAYYVFSRAASSTSKHNRAQHQVIWRFPYEFSYGEIRCTQSSAPAAATPSCLTHGSKNKPTAPHQPARQNGANAGGKPGHAPRRCTSTTKPAPKELGWIAIQITGATTEVTVKEPEKNSSAIQRSFQFLCQVCTESSSSPTWALLRATSGLPRFHLCATTVRAKRTSAKI